jgi:cysteinyl-tRNA synthetase
MLPEGIGVCGLDEHTACLIDLEKQEAEIRGIGRVFLRRHGSEWVFKKGDRVPLEVFRGEAANGQWSTQRAETPEPASAEGTEAVSFWERLHDLEGRFAAGLESGDAKEATLALLALDQTIWQAERDSENEEFITQARDLLRELIVHIGSRLEQAPQSAADCITPLVDELLALRENYRQAGRWQEADEIRDTLLRVGVIVEDTPEGALWRIQ